MSIFGFASNKTEGEKPDSVSIYVSKEGLDQMVAAEEEKFYSTLTKNTYLEGNISTKDDFVFSGGLRGNLNSSKTVHIKGGIMEGMLDAGEAKIEDGKLKGDVTSKGTVALDKLSIILGNIRAHDIVCAGKVKGDLHVDGSIMISENAVVYGNIRAAEVNIDPGAVINGVIEAVRHSMSASKFFDFEAEFMDLSDFAASLE